jgi:release factor glutamine methyltransferase
MALTVTNILSQLHSTNNSRNIDIEILLAQSISPKFSRIDLYKEPECKLTPQQAKRFYRNLKLYRSHYPLAYMVGHQEFMSLDFVTRPGVLIPRPETEFVVEAALGLLSLRPHVCHSCVSRNPNRPILDSRFYGNDGGKQRTILDIGTGSGNIAVSIARLVAPSPSPLPLGERQGEGCYHSYPIKIFASDISARALAIARQNARKHKVTQSITFCYGNLFNAFRSHRLEGRVDMIVANPPYVSPAEYSRLPVSVRRYEPRQALYAPDRGLSFYKQIIAQSAVYLKPGGYLIMEMGYKQSGLIQKLVAKNGFFDNIRTIIDYNKIKRVIVCQLNNGTAD